MAAPKPAPDPADRPIGMFDSGFGGLTVARAVIDLMPDEHLVYIGDTGRYPYGPRPLEEVRGFAHQLTRRLVDDHDVKSSGRRSGIGDWIDLSIQEVQAASLEGFGPAALVRGSEASRAGNQARAVWGIYPCADGYVGLASMARQTPSVYECIGQPGFIGDPAFANLLLYPENNELISALIGEWTSTRTAREIWAESDKHRAPFALIPTPSELLEWPPLIAAGFWRTVDHPRLGRMLDVAILGAGMAGLWQEFQQASVSVRRLGDVMNVPEEDHGLVARRPAPEGAAAVWVQDVSFRYSDRREWVCRNLSIDFPAGQLTLVTGPSGSGKSTLLNLCGLIDRPDSGSLTVAGRETAGLDEDALTLLRRESVGFIFQSFNLVPVMTVFENVEFPLLLQGVEAGRRAGRVREILDRVGLAGFEKRRPDELSGGQRQRVAIARALVKSSRLVIADEPTANLDSVTATQVTDLMRALGRDEGTTCVIATHDPRVADHCDRVFRLVDGVLQ